MTDRLNELARAITEAEDDMNASNHKDDCDHLARMDEERPHLVERIEAREKALDDARDAMRAYAQELASEGAVKVEIETSEPADWEVATSALIETFKDPTPENGQAMRDAFAPFQTEPLYRNGLDGHKED